MLAWAVEALARAESVGAIVVTAPPGRERQVEEAVGSSSAEFLASSPRKSMLLVVAGGATRAESVANGLERVEAEVVVIHDAARPLVTPSLIDSVVRRLYDRPDADGVIAAAPITDTVKRSSDPRRGVGDPTVAATEDRDRLWAAQTPQAFRTQPLRGALGVDAAATDEAMLIERAGGVVLIEPGPSWNLKVTTADDLRVAEVLLAGRRGAAP